MASVAIHGSRPDLPAYLMLLAAAMLYGLVPSANLVVATAGVPGLTYAFWFSVIGACVALTASVITRRRPGTTRQHFLAYLATGVFGIALPFVFLTYAAPQLPASIVVLLLALTPGITYALSVLIRLDVLRLSSVLGLALGLVGVVSLTWGGPDGYGGQLMWLGMVLLASLSFAISNLLAAVIRPPDAPSVSLAFGLLFAATLVLFPFYLAGGGLYVPFLNGTGADWIIVGVGLLMAAFFFLFFETIQRAGPVFFSQFNYISLLAGVVWAALFFNEIPNTQVAIAFMLIFLGVVLVNRGSGSVRPEEMPA